METKEELKRIIEEQEKELHTAKCLINQLKTKIKKKNELINKINQLANIYN